MARIPVLRHLGSLAVLIVPLAVASTTAFSAEAQAEAKAVAKLAGCTPGRVQVLRTITGPFESTIFQVNCAGIKAQDGSVGDVSVRVDCRGRNCSVIN